MKLKKDQRGFVLSGIALLLVLPAMLLAASCFRIAETSGEAVSLQAAADKVFYAGKDIGRLIESLWGEGLLYDNTEITLDKLAENYRVATGLLVDLTPTMVDNTQLTVSVYVRDPRSAARYLENVELT